MLINLTDVFTSEGKVRRESFMYEQEAVEYFGSKYSILHKTLAELEFRNIGEGKAMLTGTMELDLEIPCDRCLEPVKEHMNLSFERELFSPEAEEQSEDADEQSFIVGYEFDVDAFVEGEISLNMPTKVLCKPDCKGICRVCGKNLNEGECGCDTFVPDPRMAAIKDIYEAFNKEV